jgi:hypothetical protein
MAYSLADIEQLALANPRRYAKALAEARGTNSAPVVREETVQAAVVADLPSAGFRVLQTSVRVRPCPNCGEIDHRGYGATAGVPDTLVARDEWPFPVFVGIEIKGAKTPVSDEQQKLAEAGRIVVVRSMPAALEAARRVDKAMRAITVLRELDVRLDIA